MNMFVGLIVILGCLFLGVIVYCGISYRSHIKDREQALKMIEKEQRKERSKRKKKGVLRPSKIISDGSFDAFMMTMKVYEKNDMLEINKSFYNFKDILGYQVSETSSFTTKTSTASMVKRAAVGGVILGGLGALAGAATASKNTKSSDAIYTIVITINDLKRPNVVFRTEHKHIAVNACSVLDVIISRNKAEQ